MFRSVGARLVTGLMLVALWLSSAAAPAVAASHTRWVDNDNHPGDGPNACDTAHFHTIQAAIDASSPNDRVFVCPGTYPEQVTIDVRGLSVQAKPTHAAKIIPPGAVLEEVDGTTSLVRITARNVSLVGFRLNFPAGDGDPQPLANGCSQVDAAIVADWPHALVYSNAITALGTNTLSGDCGYLVGIVLGSDTLNGDSSLATSPFNGDTSVVAHNTVRDFKYLGIGVGGDRSARVYSNRVRYVHADDPATCVVTPVLGIQADITYPCTLTIANVPQSLEPLPFSVGIGAVGALVDVRKNSVYSTLDAEACNPFDSSFCPNSLGVGIGMLSPAPGSMVRNNTVTNTFFGLGQIDSEVAPALQGTLPSAPNGTQYTGNRANENFVGFFLAGYENVYYGNRAHLNQANVWVVGGSDNSFMSNDFRYSFDAADCIDQTSGSGTSGTANYWDGTNWGYDNSPSDICTAPFV